MGEPETNGAEENQEPIIEESFADDAVPLDGAEEVTADNALESRIAELEAENAQLKDQALRALAEAENARRRAVKDREDAGKFAISSFVRDILPVADNLRRALDSIPADVVEAEPRLVNVTGGIEATERELLKGFEKNGLERLSPEGEVFDPNKHEVMLEMPSGGQPAGTVLQVMEVGYSLNGRILRPARVGVAKDEGQGSASRDDSRPGSAVNTEA